MCGYMLSLFQCPTYKVIAPDSATGPTGVRPCQDRLRCLGEPYGEEHFSVRCGLCQALGRGVVRVDPDPEPDDPDELEPYDMTYVRPGRERNPWGEVAGLPPSTTTHPKHPPSAPARGRRPKETGAASRTVNADEVEELRKRIGRLDLGGASS